MIFILFFGVLLLVSCSQQNISDHDSRHDEAGFDEYSIILEAGSPETSKLSELVISFRDENQNPAKLAASHERIAHVVIISEDLSNFAHLHPEDFTVDMSASRKSGDYRVFFNFTKSGDYLVAVDAISDEGVLEKNFKIHADGEEKSSQIAPQFKQNNNLIAFSISNDRYTKNIELKPAESAYAVRMHIPSVIKPDEPVEFTFYFEKDGQPIKDLQPYLGASMHFAVVKHDLGEFMHEHGHVSHDGSLPEKFGPQVQLETSFPKEGIYRIIVQGKRNDTLLISYFDIKVE